MNTTRDQDLRAALSVKEMDTILYALKLAIDTKQTNIEYWSKKGWSEEVLTDEEKRVRDMVALARRIERARTRTL